MSLSYWKLKISLISWDIALNFQNTPTMITCNFAGMFQIHEAVTGPLFGDLTEAVLDEHLLSNFYNEFATEEFKCKEFHNQMVISQYLGTKPKEEVEIPTTRSCAQSRDCSCKAGC